MVVFSVWGFWKKRSLVLQIHAWNKLFVKAGGKDEATAHRATGAYEEAHQHCFVRGGQKAVFKMSIKEMICRPPKVLVTHICPPFLDRSSSKTSVSCKSSVLFSVLKPCNTGEITLILDWSSIFNMIVLKLHLLIALMAGNIKIFFINCAALEANRGWGS